MSKSFILRNDTIKRYALGYVAELPTDEDHPPVIRVGELTRTLEQSAKFHAICGDIARQKEFAGKLRTPEQWKMLLVSGHAIATKKGSEMLPGLEGEWVNLRESTAAMSVSRLSSLIEYTLAWCAENGVRLES